MNIARGIQYCLLLRVNIILYIWDISNMFHSLFHNHLQEIYIKQIIQDPINKQQKKPKIIINRCSKPRYLKANRQNSFIN